MDLYEKYIATLSDDDLLAERIANYRKMQDADNEATDEYFSYLLECCQREEANRRG
jgi:hypothetical protein